MPGLVEKFKQIEENICNFSEKTTKKILEYHQTVILPDATKVYYVIKTNKNLFSIEVVPFKQQDTMNSLLKQSDVIIENEEFIDDMMYYRLGELKNEYGEILEGILLTTFTKWFYKCWSSCSQIMPIHNACYFTCTQKKELYDLKNEYWVF
ncbi:hypothetical protein R3O67_34350 [Bacillus cereus]|uniref:hypothetical protein n=1 Tax=Bacillus cereus TaxID=1396 RepID=UPI00307967BE